MVKPLLKIGFMSGLNYGSEGCREGLWRLAAEIFRRAAVNFIVLAGGLVDGRALEAQLKEKLRGVKKDKKTKKTEEFIEEVGDYLAGNLPKVPGAKTYVITSPAYDKWIGERVARYVVERRRDILLYKEGGDRMEIKQIDAILGVYVPEKAVWMRGDYFDTPVLRVLKDEKKRSTRGLGNANAVGCFASSIYNPGDSSEIGRPYFSLPVLYKITETRTAENQIGVRILKIDSADVKEAVVVTYNFKDLASEEWALVQAPPKSSELQAKLIETMKNRGPLTVGQLADFTSFSREKVQKSIQALVQRRKSKSWPRIEKSNESQRFSFNSAWFREGLDYPMGEFEDTAVDALAAFGCLHAGCRHTDMKYFCEEVPKIILAQDITTLVGCGDFIEGLRHDLMVKGEAYGSRRFPANYTYQEKLAAYLVLRAMFKVFEERIAPFLAAPGEKSQKALEAEVARSLLVFIFIAGNHCEWVKPLGFDPLHTFALELKEFLVRRISELLAAHNLVLHKLSELVAAKVIQLEQNEPHKLPSGLSVALLHPSMSRTKTTSIRPQEMLNKADTQIVIGANFHVAEALEQWEFEKGGQRVCLQVGTIKHKSGFEEGKLKIVDFGIGALKIFSKNNRIKKTETAFYGTHSEDLQKSNEAILDEFERFVG